MDKGQLQDMNGELQAKIAAAKKENEKQDKQYAWLKGHYDRRGAHMQAYKDAMKPLIP